MADHETAAVCARIRKAVDGLDDDFEMADVVAYRETHTVRTSLRSDVSVADLRHLLRCAEAGAKWEAFGREVLRDAHEVEGMQDIGVKHGVLVPTPVTAPCVEANGDGEHRGCVCYETDNIPGTCYRIATRPAPTPERVTPTKAEKRLANNLLVAIDQLALLIASYHESSERVKQAAECIHEIVPLLAAQGGGAS